MKAKKNAILEASVTVKFIPNATDFSKYKTLSDQKTNRPTEESQVRTLVKSFTEFGVAALTITVVRSAAFSGKEEDYIADGQHSLRAAKRLGIPVDIKIVKLKEDTPLNVTKFIATLNNNSKAWSTNNFLSAFASNGIYEYKKLETVINEHGFTITDILFIYLGNGSVKESKIFKSGTLKFIDEKDSDELVKAVAKVKNVIPNKAYVRRSLFKMMRIAKDYERFANAILVAAKALETACDSFSENETEFYDHLVRIYQQEFKSVAA